MGAYRDAVIDTINIVQQIVNSPPLAPPPPPPYQTGTCSFHLTEKQSCADAGSNLWGNVKLVDNANTVIGQTPGEGTLIDTSSHLSLTSKLPSTIEIIGETRGDYVQFNYGSMAWTSDSQSMPGNEYQGWCNLGGWTKDIGCKHAESIMIRVSFSVLYFKK